MRTKRLSGFAFGELGVNLRGLYRFRYPKEFQNLDLNPGRIKFIPRQTVPRGGRMRVVVIMPALAKGHQGDPPVIAGIVARSKTTFAPHMRS